MNLSTMRAAKLLLTAALAAGAILIAGCGNGSVSNPPQQTPSIAFVAPPSGATAEVGKTISISLKVTDAAAFSNGIYVVGQGMLGAVQIPMQPPYEATLAVPADLALGNYTLTATGQTDSSENPISASTVVKVVPNPEIPVEIQLPQGGLVFEAIGERLPITVPGATEGLQYISVAPDIATV
ncbi:MAG: Ig-like domain-containing protein, partial [Gammaproteobacteria bacterium]